MVERHGPGMVEAGHGMVEGGLDFSGTLLRFDHIGQNVAIPRHEAPRVVTFHVTSSHSTSNRVSHVVGDCHD
jgi:hypothetical protein